MTRIIDWRDQNGNKIENPFKKKRMKADRKPRKHRYLYHATPQENVESIQLMGLKPGGLHGQSFAVYLSESPISWVESGMSVLRVDTKGLTGNMTTFGEKELDEILYWGRIEPDRIRIYRRGKKKEADYD